MLAKHRKNFLVIGVIIFVNLAIFWQFFFGGLYPFPGNYLISWYQPYKSDNFVNGKILLPHKPVAEDTFRLAYPLKALAFDMVKKSEWPLWNPYNGAGQPLFAILNLGFLDPFSFLFLTFPYYLAWGLYVAIQPFIIASATYLYSRKIFLSREAALFSSVAFVLSGFVVTRFIFLGYGLGAAFLPLILYIIESYISNQKTRKILLLPIIIFFLIVSTQSQLFFYIMLISITYYFYRILSQGNNFKIEKKHIIIPFILSLIGSGLSLIQILPTLELAKYANINTNTSSSITNQFLVPLGHLVEVLIPNYFGNPGTYNFWENTDYAQTVAYVGLIVSFLAYFSLGKIKTKIDLKKFFIGSTIISTLLGINWVGSRLFLSLPIPVISTEAPSRIFFLTTFSLVILGGYGIEKIINTNQRLNIKKSFIRFLPFISLAAAIFAVTFILYLKHAECPNPIITSCRETALRNTLLEVIVFIVFLVALFTYVYKAKERYKKFLLIIIFLLLITAGVYNAYKYIPFSPKSTFFPSNSLIEEIKKETKYSRVLGLGNAMIPLDFASYFRFYDPQYYHPLYIERYRELLNYVNTGKLTSGLPRGDVRIDNYIDSENSLSKIREKLFNLLSIRYLIYQNDELPVLSDQQFIIWKDKNFTLVENKKTTSRVFIVDNYSIESDSGKILKTLFDKSFEPERKIVLEQKPNYGVTNEVLKGFATIKDYKENKIEITARSNKNSFLFLSDNFYPGWKAFVDGTETKIYRADYTFRAIELPKGPHRIKFSYEPLSFQEGAILSGVALVFYFIFSVIYLNRIKSK